ncbi:MAG: chemotaxis protein CheX [Deltaproteobacteria bacterium]|nr:chemotaxis protein CheX [Deltaproteobacteria bacterium]
MSFSIECKNKLLYVYCSGDLDAAFASELIPAVTNELAQSPAAVVLDLLSCTDISDPNVFRTIAMLAKSLKTRNLKLFAMSVTGKVGSAIRDQGLDLAVPFVESEAQALALLSRKATPSTKIDVEFINPFIQGTLATFDMQCSLKATAGKPFLKGSGPQEVMTDIAGIIGLTSPHFNGSIAICFPQSLFLTIMSNMLGEKYDTITKDLEDGAAELLNIIFGWAKRVLNEKNYAIEKAIPTIVRGASLTVRHVTPNPTLVLPFDTPSGAFQIEIATESVLS